MMAISNVERVAFLLGHLLLGLYCTSTRYCFSLIVGTKIQAYMVRPGSGFVVILTIDSVWETVSDYIF